MICARAIVGKDDSAAPLPVPLTVSDEPVSGDGNDDLPVRVAVGPDRRIQHALDEAQRAVVKGDAVTQR